MKIGNLAKRYLVNSVFKDIKKMDKLNTGPGIGNDFSVVDDMVGSEGTGLKPYIAWYKAFNNFICSSDKPAFARIVMFLPQNTKDSLIKGYMKEFVHLSNKENIIIAGGHSEIIEDIKNPRFVVTMTGSKCDWRPDKKMIDETCYLVMTGFTGVLGTNYLLEDSCVTSKFSEAFLQAAEFDENCIKSEILNVVDKIKSDVLYMHDVSYGGIYKALWQTFSWCGKGLSIDNKKILIKQETIEICEACDKNPYLIDGTGAMLMICRNLGDVKRALDKSQIPFAVIGKITDEKECIVNFTKDQYRVLAADEE